LDTAISGNDKAVARPANIKRRHLKLDLEF
jgi:hypothetical protein